MRSSTICKRTIHAFLFLIPSLAQAAFVVDCLLVIVTEIPDVRLFGVCGNDAVTRNVLFVPLDYRATTRRRQVVALRKGPRILCECVCDCATPLWAPHRSRDFTVRACLIGRYLAHGIEHPLLKLGGLGYGHVIIGTIHRPHTFWLLWPGLVGRVGRRFVLHAFLWYVFFVLVKRALLDCHVHVGNVRPPARIHKALRVECCVPRHAGFLSDWYTNCVIVSAYPELPLVIKRREAFLPFRLSAPTVLF